MLTKRFLALLMAGHMIFGFSGSAMARLTNQTNETSPDAACWGATGVEVCVDASGNLVPTTDSDTSLGTSALYWANGYIDAITTTGNLTVGGDASVAGTQTIGASGDFVTTPASSVQSVYYGTGTITPSSRFVVFNSSGNMNMNAVNGPIISTVSAVNGQWLTLITTGSVIGIPTDVTLNTAMVYSSTRGAFVSISSVTPRTFIFKTGTGWLQQ